MDYQIPRRNKMDLWTPAEKAIHNALLEVEKLPGDVRLTEAVILLGEAQAKVADYIDSTPNSETATPDSNEEVKPFLLQYHLSRRNDEGWGNVALVFAEDEKSAIEKLIKEKTYTDRGALSSHVVAPDHIVCLNII